MRKLLLTLLVIGTIYAGETGKIAGTVVDATTGEPLPGANVVIVGTRMGAATDVNGFYFILNVPPGVYKLKATLIGYQPVVEESVIVRADQTTTINFKLKQTVIKAKPVVVKAKRPLVKKDVTASLITTDKQDLQKIPVETVSGVISMKAGVTTGPSGDIHVRGGRSGEVAYLIDGIPIVDPYLNGLAVYVPTNVIREMDLVAGTFNAEYGNAMSGVVNIVTDEGSSKFRGSVSGYTGDRLSNHTHVFENINKFDLFNDIDFRWSLSGPVLFRRNLTFYFGGRYLNSKGYLYGINYYLPTDTKYDLNHGHGDSSYVAMNPSTENLWNLKFTFRPTNSIKLSWTNLYTYYHYKSYIHSLKWEPLATPHHLKEAWQSILTLNQILSPRTFYSLKFSYYWTQFRQFAYNSYYCLGYLYPYWGYFVSAHQFRRGGVSTSWFKRYTRSYVFRFDITSQVTPVHMLKSGIMVTRYTIYRLSLNVTNPLVFPPTLPVNDTLYDVSQYVHHPSEFSAYVQDKMEFKDMVVNAGVRFDWFDPKWRIWVDDSAPSPMIWDTLRGPFPGFKKVKPKYQISPRIGIAFPISASGIFHFSYGHFFQIPPYYYIYRNSKLLWSKKPNRTILGNPDLKPQRTVAYEVGFKQALSENFGLEVIGYYKDVRDLLSTKLMPTYISGDHYMIYTNRDYANIRGVSFYLKFRNLGMFSGEIDYTYQIAEGSNSRPRDLFADLRHGYQPPKYMVPLDWDERHKINFVLTMSQPNDWSISLTGTYGSGLPYTPTDTTGQALMGGENSGRKPPTYNLDLSASKYMRYRNLRYTLSVKVYNLLDTMNELLVYTDTGRATYTHQTRATADPGYYIRPYYFSPPRLVKIGISMNF